MTISYKWLSEYLPVTIEPERLSIILTSIGLEVESMEHYEEVKGGLKGLIIGQVLEASQHPNADKLKLTKVNIGGTEPLQIVCGAPNVEAGQKVVVAPVGTTIFPVQGEPLTMKVAKIRGSESYGMICAEDEIGIGESHAGIMVLPADATIGTPAAEYFNPYSDIIYEIGLTPNRMDAMSHWGVARDVCAYLSHHDKKEVNPIIPVSDLTIDNNDLPIEVIIENTIACPRYSGVSISNVIVKESPGWLQQRLKSIGLRPINNIVDITNFIQHETGQPLHAFDYDAIWDKKVIVRNEADNTIFKTLDEKERKLSAEDLVICNGKTGMCIAGVFGGFESGVTSETKNIFLESAFFDPTTIRKTSFRHGLRTDAATRFEKGIDISNTVNVLKRAANLIKEIGGGKIASHVIDIYPNPEAKKEVVLKYQYLKKLSGNNYSPLSVKIILERLGFTVLHESNEAITLAVPHHKRDVSLAADVVEEILRIDGLDNIEIPSAITITPSIEENYKIDAFKEKVANTLVGLGYNEILTNSITNSKYFGDEQRATAINLLNNLSNELDVLRPAMLPTALEIIQFNNNRKNTNLKFFEWGKTYKTEVVGNYLEENHFCIYLTGTSTEAGWKGKSAPVDIYYLKGITQSVLKTIGLQASFVTAEDGAHLENKLNVFVNGKKIGKVGKVAQKTTNAFDIKQAVFFANLNWDEIIEEALKTKIQYKEVSKYPSVERDLAMVVPKNMMYEELKNNIIKLRLGKLQDIRLFDIFESDKLGKDKKSIAINFTFLDEEKTLTDKEIDGWMNKIMTTLEKDAGAEIRK